MRGHPNSLNTAAVTLPPPIAEELCVVGDYLHTIETPATEESGKIKPPSGYCSLGRLHTERREHRQTRQRLTEAEQQVHALTVALAARGGTR